MSITRWKVRFRFAAALILILFLPGCWSSHEISDLTIVTMIGVDRTESGHYILTAFITKPQKSAEASSSGGGQQTKGKLILNIESPSLVGGMRKLQAALTKKIYWPHTLAVIFGEEAARRNMAQNLDTFVRQYDFRLQTPILIAKGRAEDIMKIEPSLQGSLGAEVAGLVMRIENDSDSYAVDFAQFKYRLSSNADDPMAPIVTKAADLGIEARTEKRTSLLGIQGSAVFKGGRYIGSLDDEESQGVLWIRGKVKYGEVRLPCLDSKEGNIMVDYDKEYADLSVNLRNGRPEVHLQIYAYGNISEVTCENLRLDPPVIQAINREMETAIRGKIESALQKAQHEWQADVFGFGEAINRKYPGVWKGLSHDWHRGGLDQLKVDVDIQATIRRSGLIHDSLIGGNE